MKKGRKPLDPEVKKKRALERQRKYWAEHSAEIAAKRKLKRDPQKNKERVYKWREANKEKWNAYMRQYKRRKRKIDNEKES